MIGCFGGSERVPTKLWSTDFPKTLISNVEANLEMEPFNMEMVKEDHKNAVNTYIYTTEFPEYVYLVNRRIQDAVEGFVFHAFEYKLSGLQVSLNRDVAIKVLWISGHKNCNEMFKTEIQYKSQMGGHENVLVNDRHWIDKDVVYIVMPHAQLEDLCEVLNRRPQPFSEPEAKWLFHQILKGAAFLHERGLAFRDHSVENILIFYDEATDVIIPKITDPGQVVPLKYDSNGRICEIYDRPFGKCFCPPETYNKRSPYDPTKVDVFCLGYVLYFLVTKTPAFGHAKLTDPGWSLIVSKNYKSFLEQRNGLHLSAVFQDLLWHMLDPIYKRRYSLQMCLAHPWFDLNMIPLNKTRLLYPEASLAEASILSLEKSSRKQVMKSHGVVQTDFGTSSKKFPKNISVVSTDFPASGFLERKKSKSKKTKVHRNSQFPMCTVASESLEEQKISKEVLPLKKSDVSLRTVVEHLPSQVPLADTSRRGSVLGPRSIPAVKTSVVLRRIPPPKLSSLSKYPRGSLQPRNSISFLQKKQGVASSDDDSVFRDRPRASEGGVCVSRTAYVCKVGQTFFMDSTGTKLLHVGTPATVINSTGASLLSENNRETDSAVLSTKSMLCSSDGKAPVKSSEAKSSDMEAGTSVKYGLKIQKSVMANKEINKFLQPTVSRRDIFDPVASVTTPQNSKVSPTELRVNLRRTPSQLVYYCGSQKKLDRKAILWKGIQPEKLLTEDLNVSSCKKVHMHGNNRRISYSEGISKQPVLKQVQCSFQEAEFREFSHTSQQALENGISTRINTANNIITSTPRISNQILVSKGTSISAKSDFKKKDSSPSLLYNKTRQLLEHAVVKDNQRLIESSVCQKELQGPEPESIMKHWRHSVTAVPIVGCESSAQTIQRSLVDHKNFLSDSLYSGNNKFIDYTRNSVEKKQDDDADLCSNNNESLNNRGSTNSSGSSHCSESSSSNGNVRISAVENNTNSPVRFDSFNSNRCSQEVHLWNNSATRHSDASEAQKIRVKQEKRKSSHMPLKFLFQEPAQWRNDRVTDSTQQLSCKQSGQASIAFQDASMKQPDGLLPQPFGLGPFDFSKCASFDNQNVNMTSDALQLTNDCTATDSKKKLDSSSRDYFNGSTSVGSNDCSLCGKLPEASKLLTTQSDSSTGSSSVSSISSSLHLGSYLSNFNVNQARDMCLQAQRNSYVYHPQSTCND